MHYLVVSIVTVTGLSPTTVVYYPDVMRTVILPAPIDGGGLWWEVRVVLSQCFPEKLGSSPG
ncbi:hypothetical protein ABLB69_19665 [Xenorhabdus khoisanae]|uniref:hypothetical protein n=1 Tax=Xenorhabdus khoisanae TaxID=880157 RepID=UPI0032B77FCD